MDQLHSLANLPVKTVIKFCSCSTLSFSFPLNKQKKPMYNNMSIIYPVPSFWNGTSSTALSRLHSQARDIKGIVAEILLLIFCCCFFVCFVFSWYLKYIFTLTHANLSQRGSGLDCSQCRALRSLKGAALCVPAREGSNGEEELAGLQVPSLTFAWACMCMCGKL